MQKDLLASKLVESNPDLLETARRNSKLCNTVKCQLCEAVRLELENIIARSEQSPLVDSKG